MGLPDRSYNMHFFWIFGIVLISLNGCYTFKGFSIDQDLTTFYVANFRNSSPNAPPTINQTFQEQLKLKVARESRLQFNDENPDIEFEGAISNFSVQSVSPQPGEFAALNRLEVTINIEYTNHRNSDDDWTQSFSRFEDFGAQENLLDVQDELINLIFDQIIEDIFNKAFTNW